MPCRSSSSHYEAASAVTVTVGGCWLVVEQGGAVAGPGSSLGVWVEALVKRGGSVAVPRDTVSRA